MLKRIFDIFFSLLLLSLFAWLVVLCWIIAAVDTQSSGIFLQKRIGQFGKPFKIIKLKSFKDKNGVQSISSFGKFIRRKKIDELPQLLNVLIGDMSFVGPRPDIAGYYDLLEGENRKILELKPGITSEASLKYANEEFLLSQQENTQQYNDAVLFPDKVKMNLEYYYSRSFFLDFKIIFRTFMQLF